MSTQHRDELIAEASTPSKAGIAFLKKEIERERKSDAWPNWMLLPLAETLVAIKKWETHGLAGILVQSKELPAHEFFKGIQKTKGFPRIAPYKGNTGYAKFLNTILFDEELRRCSWGREANFVFHEVIHYCQYVGFNEAAERGAPYLVCDVSALIGSHFLSTMYSVAEEGIGREIGEKLRSHCADYGKVECKGGGNYGEVVLELGLRDAIRCIDWLHAQPQAA